MSKSPVIYVQDCGLTKYITGILIISVFLDFMAKKDIRT